jgi:hypothetical protein
MLHAALVLRTSDWPAAHESHHHAFASTFPVLLCRAGLSLRNGYISSFQFWNTQEEHHGAEQHGEENIQKKNTPGHHNGLCSIPVPTCTYLYTCGTPCCSQWHRCKLQNTLQRIEPENSGVSEHAVFYQYWRRMALPSTECAHII